MKKFFAAEQLNSFTPSYFSKTLLLAVMLLVYTSASAQLSGTYTVCPSGCNYASPAAAASALSAGVSGPVVFNISNGTYNGAVSINNVSGASSVNTITFKSTNEDASLVTLQHTTNVLTITNTPYVSLLHLTIDNTGTSSSAMVLGANADNMTIDGCTINGSTSTNTTFTNAAIYSSQTTNGNGVDNFTLKNSVITSGAYGVYMAMNATERPSGLRIIDNSFENNNLFGFRLAAWNAVEVIGNTFHRSIATGTSYAMYLDDCDNKNIIADNYVYTTGSGTWNYGIYLNGSTSTLGNNALIANNSIQVVGSTTATSNGIHQAIGCNYYDIIGNTLYVSGGTGTSSSTFCYYNLSSNSGTVVKNNIFLNAASATGSTSNQTIYAPNTGGIASLNNNCYWTQNTGNPFRARYGGTNHTVFATYTTASGETNSLNIDPVMQFVAGVGWKATASALVGAGEYMASIPRDIDGNLRANPTTIGAHENGVSTTPVVVTSTTSLSPFSTQVTVPSASQTYTVEGYNLTGNISITAPTHFEIREAGIGGFGSTLSFVPSSGAVSTKTIEVRYNPLAPGAHADHIDHASTGATTVEVAVQGNANIFMNGTVTVGTGGTYTSITNDGGLFEAINTNIISGNVVAEIISDLTDEVGTHALNEWSEIGTGGYTLTIQSNNASPKLISGDNTNAANGLFRFNGADRVTIDGGTGNERRLTFRNTGIASNDATFLFINDAKNITIQNATIEGSTANFTGGVIVFGTAATGGTGNDSITIQRCDIKEAGLNFPYQAIYSLGTSVAAANDNIVISECNISNYFNASTAATVYAGIHLGNFNSAWTIANNRFFQTATRSVVASTSQISAIRIAPSTAANAGTGFDINGNIIGYADAYGNGVTTYTSSGVISPLYSPIYMQVGTSPQSQVRNNVIRNITITSNSTGNLFNGIYLASTGSSQVTNNTFGATGDGNEIAIHAPRSGAVVSAIRSETTGTVSITGNNIVNIIGTAMTATNSSMSLNGIVYTAGSVTVSNNNIASLASNSNATSNGSTVAGINATAGSSYTSVISNNTITGLVNNNTAAISTSRVIGVSATSGAMYTITGNTIHGLTSVSGNVSNGNNASVIGISLNSANSSSHRISENTIYNLNNTGTGAGGATGIYFAASTGTGYIIDKNFLHSFTPGTGGGAYVTGISIGASSTNSQTTVRNNMIRLGIDGAGMPIETAHFIRGIDIANTFVTHVQHNSVYIGGNVPSTTANHSYGFSKSASGGTLHIYNNIFMNARAQASGGKHYAIHAINTTTFNSDYNILYAIGTGTYTGLLASSDQVTLQDWRSATANQDLNSAACDPAFENATGTSSTVDLHLNDAIGTSAEGRGNPAALTPAVLEDFDGEVRDTPALGTVDIGADAGSYVALAGPTLTATANGLSTLTICEGESVTFAATATGGSACAAWQYSWYNGTMYWDGTDFASSTPMYNTSWNSIHVSALTSGGTYTVGANCVGDTENCIATSYSTVVVNMSYSPATFNATIGVPANGLNHAIQLNWATVTGATAYEVEYSINGTTWTSLYAGTATDYLHSTGDNPNAPYYYRVRSVFGSQICNWKQSAQYPIHTAADAPELLVLNNATEFTMDITIPAETPVANPSMVTYSIRCATTNQFVQADGTLGATEVFQTRTAWGAITVTGLTPNTEYCFHARAKNSDGDVREGMGGNVLPLQPFDTSSSLSTASSSGPSSMFWSPSSCTTGGLQHYTTGGCTGGYVGKEYSGTGTFGCFVRTPQISAVGNTEMKLLFDISHSYNPSYTADRVRVYMWSDNSYKQPISLKINGVETSIVDINGRQLPINVERNCVTVEATFDMTTTTNLSSGIYFYIEPNKNSSANYSFSARIDNVSMYSASPTACLSTAPMYMSGNYTIGDGGDFPSLTNPGGFFETINMATVAGDITGTVISDLAESGMHPLNQTVESGVGNYTISIVPDGNTTRLIEGNHVGTNAATAGLIRFNGADRIIIDGRDPANLAAGGRHLIFRNTYASTNQYASTISYLNDACNHSLRYTQVEGSALNTSTGTIRIASGTATGNDNIAIEHNHVRDRSDNNVSSYNGIYSLGTFSASHDSLTILNNEIFNIWAASANTNAILVDNYNRNSVVTGNSIYQTAVRNATGSSTHVGINISSNDGNYVVNNNYIGGSAPMCAGDSWTQTGTVNATFIGIRVDGATSSDNIIDGNVVRNMTWYCSNNGTSAKPGIFTGIYSINGGSTITNNLIGSGTTVDAIKVRTTTSNASTYGIAHGGSSGTLVIDNNIVGGFTLEGSAAAINHNFYGIAFSSAGTSTTRTITNNLVGSTKVDNSIYASNNATGTTSTASQSIVGISMDGGANPVIIDGNTVANLTNNYIGSNTNGVTHGIVSPFGLNTVTDNLVYNLKSSAAVTSVGANSAVAGIVMTSSVQGSQVSNNTVHSLNSTASSAATTISGIVYSGATSGTQYVGKNNIHSFSHATTSTTATMVGLHVVSGTVTVHNNMIRLGIDGDGNDVIGGYNVYGIQHASTTAGANYYFNSVYIGGKNVTGNSISAAFARTAGTSTMSLLNNIWANERENISGTSNHSAMSLNSTAGISAPNGSNHNMFYTGTSGANTIYNVSTPTALMDWQATGLDINSVYYEPSFINPTGDDEEVDLHLDPLVATPAESGGTSLAMAYGDIDNDVRAGESGYAGTGSMPDMGADENAFIALDVMAPVIIVDAIPTQSIACGTTLNLTVTATITDGQSALATGPLAPRLWWRLSTGTYASLAPTTVVGDVFTYALSITSASAGDVYEYYVAAQDVEGNIGYSHKNSSSPVHADVATAPSVINAVPATFVVNATMPLSGTVRVGVGETYTSLNAPNSSGLFYNLMTYGLMDDLEVLITSDLNETSLNYVLGRIPEYCGSDYTVTIRPDAAVNRTIYQASGGHAMINFSGATRVIIDGSYSGSGRYLTFASRQNTPTFHFNGGTTELGTTDIVVSNSNIEGNNRLVGGYGPGVISFAGPNGTGSEISNITITGNVIRNRSDLSQTQANTPNILVNAGGSNAQTLPLKQNITISNNEMFNFNTSAVNVQKTSSGTAGIGNNWTIEGNRIYQPTIFYDVNQYVIYFDAPYSSSGNVISNNVIGGSSSDMATSGFWNFSVTYQYNISETWVIFANAGGASITEPGCTIEGNFIHKINGASPVSSAMVGIQTLNGYHRIINNMVGDSSYTSGSSLMINGGQLSYSWDTGILIGIWARSSSESYLDGNVVSNLQTTGPWSFLDGIVVGSNVDYLGSIVNSPAGKTTVTNNHITKLRSGSALQNSLISSEAMMAMFIYSNSTGNIITDNVIDDNGVNGGWNRNARANGVVLGVVGSGYSGSGEFSRNKITRLFNTSTGDNSGTINPEVNCLVLSTGDWTVSNNFIYTDNNGLTNRNTTVLGIKDGLLNAAGQSGKYYYNTVNIAGVNNGSNASYAYLRFAVGASFTLQNGATTELKNNLLINERSGSGNHRAIGNITSNPSFNWSSSDYNFFANRGLGHTTRWGTTDYNFSTWQTLSGGDANTVHKQVTASTTSSTLNPADMFVDQSIGDLHLSTSNATALSFVEGNGVLLSTVTTDIDNDARSNPPTIGADEANGCAMPVVLSQPANQNGCEDGTVQFIVENGGLAPFTYQWQEFDGTNWNNITDGGVYAGSTNDTLVISNIELAMHDLSYRVVIANECGSVTSNSATLTVVESPQILTYSPPSLVNNICALSNTSFGVTASGDALSYAWQVSSDEGVSWTNVTNTTPYSGATTASLNISNVPSAMHGNYYRVIVSGTCAPADTSDNMLLNVGDVTIVTQPLASTVICNGGDGMLTIEATGNSVSYLWQVNTGSGFVNITDNSVYNGATNDTLLITGATNTMTGYTYRVLVGSVGCGTLTSNSSTLTIQALPTATVMGNNVICSGDETSIGFMGTANAIVSYSVNGGSTQTITLNASGMVLLNTGALATTTTYNLVSVELNGCSQSLTGSAQVVVVPAPTATISASSSTLCAGSSSQVSFTGGPSYGEVTYNVNGGSNQYISLDENGEAVLSTGALYASLTYTLVSVMGEYCEASVTGSVTITVSSEPEASAGSDITASCDDTSVTLSGATATGGTILWTTSGNGTFNNAALQNPVYTLGSMDDFSVTLTMTITGAPGCGNAIDQVVINIAQPIWYIDADGDGYGDASATPNCTGGVGYADNNLDFCDSNASLNPATVWWVDNDGDGYGVYAQTVGDLGVGCATTYNMLGVGTLVILGGDCNDTNADVHPGATEVCHNGIDDNCNGVQNEGGCPALPPPANDNPLNNNPTIGNNTNVYPNCVSVSGTTLGATTNPATGTRDVWYRFVAISNGISVQVSSTVIDPIIYLFDATNLTTPLEVENIITGTGAEILNYSNLIPGNTYRIAIASANDADGVFSICARQLRMPQCQTNGIKSMCELAHSAVTGAPSMTATFTDVVTDVTTSHTFSGYSYALSAPSLDLRYQSSYDVHITATYPLVNGLGEPEVIQVPGNSVCNITIAPHALIEVKANNRCTSTTLNRTAVLSGGYLSGANCNFSSFRFEFTPVDNCAGANPRYDETFTKVIIAAGPNISLNYAFNQLAASSHPATGYWQVRIRPRFTGYEGEYGPAHVIAVRNTKSNAGMAVEPNFEPVKGVSTVGSTIDANIYPNPNNGELVNLNITGITSNEVYVRVMDSMGREVYTNRYSVDGTLNTMVSFIHPLAQGVYMVEMRAGEEVKTQRMIVTK